MNNTALLVFVKSPVVREVKTRLAASIGHEKAMEVYQQLLKHTRATIKKVDVKTQIWYGNHIPNDDIWSDYPRFEQPDGDLGAKMKYAFLTALRSHSKVVLIGSDCPELSTQHLEEAFHYLENHDVVLGPATDGGYYLIGMKQMHDSLFAEIAWSTANVLDQTVHKILRSGLSYALLAPLTDIDTAEDLQQFPAFFNPIYK